MRMPLVTRDAPRLKIVMDWGGERPVGAALLYVGRVGEPEFAVYRPLEERGGELLFEFDDLLFYREPGAYFGRLMIGGREQTGVMFVYRNDVRMMSYGNPDHV